MNKLGQHFLKSEGIVNQIIKASELTKKDVVLEIGPGRGVLTKELIKKTEKVVAIEKDKKLFDFLQEKFKDTKNLELVHGDILKIEHWKLIENYKLKIENFKVVANIPYYITSRFLRNFLESEKQPNLIVLMIQKEVAERIVAQPPHMSKLSVSVQAYGKPKIIEKVPKKYFSPRPKIDSAIIKIEKISKEFFSKDKLDEQKFFEMLQKGFSHKRKMLKNNLKISEDILNQCDLSEKIRAQELSLKDWICLYRCYN